DMPVFRVDDEVWNWVKGQAEPLVDTPNTVLRRIAGLDRLPRRERPAHAKQASNDYVVTKRPDRHNHWWFQIYKRKLELKARKGGFSVVVVCDRGARPEKVFRIP